MKRSTPTPPHPSETGAITIMVALMMLVLLTMATLGLSRNSFREIVSSATARQGAMTRNVADSGLEWSIYWMDPVNKTSATGMALDLANLKTALLTDGTLAGVAKDIVTGNDYSPGGTLQTGMQLTGPSGVTEGFTVGLTRMGKLAVTDTSQGVSYSPASGSTSLAPDLWAIRSDAQVVQGNVTFTHAKEAWVSTAIQ